jgi:hypothetical protein
LMVASQWTTTSGAVEFRENARAPGCIGIDQGVIVVNDDNASNLLKDLPAHPEEAERPERQSVTFHHETEEMDALDEAEASGGLRARFMEVNKELWLILLMLAIAGAMNYLLTAKRMIICLYTIPTVLSAYFYGRRHAVLTAFASAFLVGLLAHFNPLFLEDAGAGYEGQYDLLIWGGILVLTAYAMGTLHEREKSRVRELRRTYHGLLLILRQLVCKDKFTENHAFRVSVIASKIAEYRGLSPDRIEDVRAASLLHDIANLETSREGEYGSGRKDGAAQASKRDLVGGPIHRIIPVILKHRESYDASRLAEAGDDEVPLEARIIKVADAFDTLTTEWPDRKAVTPLEAKNIIARESGTEFDPTVVHAMVRAFRRGELLAADPAL